MMLRNQPPEKRPNYREIFPGTFTMGNVVCGFLAILSAFEGNITTACWFIILAAFLDALDGKIARLSGGTSKFGVELDSLADFLSFGVAPAVIVYSVKLNSLGKWGWIISVVYIMSAVYRLARFNLFADTDEKKDFVGLPVPMAAIALVSGIILSYYIWGKLEYSELLVSMIILFSFLMISHVQYDTIPEKFDTQQSRLKLIALIIAGLLIIFQPRLLLFPLMASYILYGMIRELYRLFFKGVGKATDRNDGDLNRKENQDEQ
ncbi:MAG: CDP-diacylglycerol--serine O-phosphatidyltransferase [Candidatus Zixiibacteriota bacterium]|nr:MAG: CDP-diacylglycerol--serine O-phosphatidyltransferase [candidate division Zixibacteria bacterium]